MSDKEGTTVPSEGKDPFQVSLDGISVCIMIPCNRDMPTETVIALMQSWDKAAAMGLRLSIQIVKGNSIVQCARNQAVNQFLETDFNRLFWIDSDIEWQPESFMRLIAISTECDIVGASYPMRGDPILFCVDPPIKDGEEIEHNRFGCIRRNGFGLGFTCVNRYVIEKLADQAPGILLPHRTKAKNIVKEVFRCESVKDWRSEGEDFWTFRGEDIGFFEDAQKAGFEVWMDPTIELGHVGSKVFRASFVGEYLKHGGS